MFSKIHILRSECKMYNTACCALFIPFALLLLQVRSMRNQGQGRRQSHLTSVTGFTFITIGCDHARSGSFIVKNHDNCAAAQKVCHRYGIMWLFLLQMCQTCSKVVDNVVAAICRAQSLTGYQDNINLREISLVDGPRVG